MLNICLCCGYCIFLFSFKSLSSLCLSFFPFRVSFFLSLPQLLSFSLLYFSFYSLYLLLCPLLFSPSLPSSSSLSYSSHLPFSLLPTLASSLSLFHLFLSPLPFFLHIYIYPFSISLSLLLPFPLVIHFVKLSLFLETNL